MIQYSPTFCPAPLSFDLATFPLAPPASTVSIYLAVDGFSSLSHFSTFGYPHNKLRPTISSTRSSGVRSLADRLLGPVGTFSTFRTVNRPSVTLPKTTCFPSRKSAGAVVMKNWSQRAKPVERDDQERTSGWRPTRYNEGARDRVCITGERKWVR